MSRASARYWLLICDEWVSRFASIEGAERALLSIEAAGHCRNEHLIVPAELAPNASQR